MYGGTTGSAGVCDSVVEGGFTLLGDGLPSYEEALTHPTHDGTAPNPYPNQVGATAAPYAAVAGSGDNSALYPNMQPSAPPPPTMQHSVGGSYPHPPPQGQFGFPPPPFIPPPAYPPPPGAQFAYGYNMAHPSDELSDDLILSIFEKFATKKSWFFNRPKNLKQNVKIQKKTLEFRLRYTLQTYVEKRRLHTRTEKIIGLHRGSVQSVPIGDLWSYDLRPDKLWWEGSKDKVLQHTVDRCTVCLGACNKPCHHCARTGKVECIGIHNGNPPCRDCNGTRLKSCNWCRGRGVSNCDECDGKGVLRVIVSVVADYCVKKDYHFDGPPLGVPDKKMQATPGNSLLSLESTPPIQMLPFYPESTTLNAQSNELLNKHYNKYVMGNTSEARAIKQKHEVMNIPVTYVEAMYNGKLYHLWVFGKSHSVHCPDFSSCSIL